MGKRKIDSYSSVVEARGTSVTVPRSTREGCKEKGMSELSLNTTRGLTEGQGGKGFAVTLREKNVMLLRICK